MAANTLVVGNNTGASNERATFAAALADATPGTNIVIRGVLSEQIRWRENKSGSADAPITVTPWDPQSKIDGRYALPNGSEGITPWIAPDGTKGFHSSLVAINADYVTWGVPVVRSQGRALQLGGTGRRKKGLVVEGGAIQGVRTAPIDIRNVDGATVRELTISDSCNYNRNKGSGDTNWAGAIKTLDARNVLVENVNIWQHYGNVVTPSRLSDGVTVRNVAVWDSPGAAFYSHYARNVLFDNCLAFFTPNYTGPRSSGFYLNNEEEFTNEGSTPGNVVIDNCMALGTTLGLILGGNEGTTGAAVATDGMTMRNSVLLNCDIGMRLNNNAQVRNGQFVGNHFLGSTRLVTGSMAPYSWADNTWSDEAYAPTHGTGNKIAANRWASVLRAAMPSDAYIIRNAVRAVIPPVPTEKTYTITEAQYAALMDAWVIFDGLLRALGDNHAD